MVKRVGAAKGQTPDSCRESGVGARDVRQMKLPTEEGAEEPQTPLPPNLECMPAWWGTLSRSSPPHPSEAGRPHPPLQGCRLNLREEKPLSQGHRLDWDRAGSPESLPGGRAVPCGARSAGAGERAASGPRGPPFRRPLRAPARSRRGGGPAGAEGRRGGAGRGAMAGSRPRPLSWGWREAGAGAEAAAGGPGPGPCRGARERRARAASGKPAVPAARTP